MKHRFICEIWDRTGDKGWRQADQPGFYPLGGMAVAHDILEHFPNDDEGVDAELRAHGAMVHVRAMNGYWIRPHGDYGGILASEFEEMFRLHHFENVRLATAPRTYRPRCDYEHSYIEDTIHAARKLIKSELEYDFTEKRFTDHQLEAFLEEARGWMRVGLRRAKCRFRNFFSSYEVCALFGRIEKDADRALQAAEVGDELTITIIGTDHRVKLIQPEYA